MTPALGGSPADVSTVRVDGAAVVYRLYDVGYEIRLDRALDLLASSAAERIRPERGEAQAIQIRNPPITVLLGLEDVVVDGRQCTVEISARIFDFGVVSLHMRVPTPGELTWSEFTAFGNSVDAATGRADVFDRQLQLLTERIRPATERFRIADVEEEYIVYRVVRVTHGGSPAGAEVLRALDVAPLVLNESRPLSAEARRELLPHRFSYYADDLAVLTWDNALVVDTTTSGDTDVEFILEFANAQLLELRFYDALLDAELTRMYVRIAGARTGPRARINRRYASLLGELQALVADATEIVERVENSIKVTDDVYLARVYAAALEIFRGRAWRAGIDRKLGIIRDTYAMLNAESQAARSEALEWAIVVLIVLEIVIAFVVRRA